MTIRVLLVDDDPLVRAGLRLMLRSAPDIDVVGEAGNGAVAITAAAELAPDVVLMDIRMPGTDGVTATAAIMAANTRAAAAPRAVALTTFDADELVRRAITAGAVGYLVKDTPPRRDHRRRPGRRGRARGAVAGGDAAAARPGPGRVGRRTAQAGPRGCSPSGSARWPGPWPTAPPTPRSAASST
jgi:CheY-like chemotaxis protein